MRSRSRSLVPLLAVLLVVSAVGCAGTPPARVAYTSIDSATTAVQSAMGAFNVLYQNGKATEAQRTQVLAAYAKYQKIALLAVDMSQSITDQVSVNQIISTAAGDVIAVINSFGVK